MAFLPEPIHIPMAIVLAPELLYIYVVYTQIFIFALASSLRRYSLGAQTKK